MNDNTSSASKVWLECDGYAISLADLLGEEAAAAFDRMVEERRAELAKRRAEGDRAWLN